VMQCTAFSHRVVTSCITESYSTDMQLIGQIQYGYVENLFKVCFLKHNNTL